MARLGGKSKRARSWPYSPCRKSCTKETRPAAATTRRIESYDVITNSVSLPLDGPESAHYRVNRTVINVNNEIPKLFGEEETRITYHTWRYILFIVVDGKLTWNAGICDGWTPG